MRRKMLCIFFLGLLGCKQTVSEDEINFKLYFKQAVFERSLFYGFNKSQDFIELMKLNKDGGGEFIMNSDKTIDRLAKELNAKMIKDSIASIGRVAEGSAGKHVISASLSLYTSKKLDSIANEEFSKYYKNEQ